MPQLDWNEYAFIECLEALPVVGEHATEHQFTVIRGELTLVLTLWQFESVAQIELKHPGNGQPIISFAIVIRGVARHLMGPTSECIEFNDAAIVASRFSYSDLNRMGIDVYDKKRMPAFEAIRLFVNPAIRIDLPRWPLPL